MNAFSFRLAKANDSLKLRELEKSHQSFSFFLSDIKDVQQCLLDGHSLVAVDNQTGNIVAFCLIHVTEYQTAYIEKVFVHPLARGVQLQIKLVNAVLSNSKIKICYTMVSPENKISLHNFKKCGFTEKYKADYKGKSRIILAYETNS